MTEREEEFERLKKWIQPALPFDISNQKLVDMSQPLKVGELIYGKPLPIPKLSIKFLEGIIGNISKIEKDE